MRAQGQSSVPASVKIAFVIFIALGFIIAGAFWMRGNEKRKENELLAEQSVSMSLEIERKKELASMPIEDYVKENANNFGYVYPGEEYYPIKIEE